MRLRLLLASVAACAAVLPAPARVLTVATPEALQAAISSARPGDTIALQAGEWRDVAVVFKARGEAKRPVTLAAGPPGAARFTGHSSLTIDGESLVVSGLLFTDGRREQDAVVAIRGANNRLTDTAIVRFNPPDLRTRYPWVRVEGRGHRIDHCRFEGQSHSGATLQVVVGAGDNRHQIDHNHFLHRPPGDGNGFECLQLGQSPDSLKPSRSVVEYNLFEACDGATEVISNQSCENIYRYNTLWRCAGTLTLRHGDRCVVEKNVFLGEGKPGAGGICVIGREHVVRDNYLEGVGDVTGGVIAIYAGVPGSPLNGYFAADGATIRDNYLFGTHGVAFNVSAGYQERDRTVLPRNVHVERNWVLPASDRAVALARGTPGPGLVVTGNLYHDPVAMPAGALAKGFTAGPPPPDRGTFLALLHPVTPAQTDPSWWPRE